MAFSTVSALASLLGSSVERAPWGWVLLVVIIVALIRVWPALSLHALNAAKELRGEKRDDLHECNTRLDAMDVELRKALEQIHQLDMKLVGTITAYRILHADITEHRPDSSALVQARVIFKETWDDKLMHPGAISQ